MLIFIIARNKDEDYNNYIRSSLNVIQGKSIEITDSEGEHKSIFEKYNLAITDMLKSEVNDNDIVIFTHEDVKIVDNLFKDKLEYLFENKKDIGICGFVGTQEYNELGGWWMNSPNKLKGHIIQEDNGKDNHLIKGDCGYFNDIIVVDGCIFAVRAKVLKDGIRFDESFNGFHFYDITFCLDTLLKTEWKICVADILIKHKSSGMGSLTKEWFEAKNKTIKKYKDIGLTFPVTTESLRKYKDATNDTKY
jgi:hypothetical protein